MAHIGMAYIVMTDIVTAHIVMAYVVMAYTGMAYVVMAYIVMTYVVMAHVQALVEAIRHPQCLRPAPRPSPDRRAVGVHPRVSALPGDGCMTELATTT